MFQVNNVEILSNQKITKDIYLMKLLNTCNVIEGQFFMIKPITDELILYRPISIFDADEESISFLYLVKGKGTKILSNLKAGDKVSVHGPYGNGFPKDKKNLGLVGGGIGMAPLLLAAKRNKEAKLMIGIRENIYNETEIENIKNLFKDVNVNFKIGGLVTDIVEFNKYDTIFTCGPEVMMEAISKKHNNVFVSMEAHMGCGVGACLSCSCRVDNHMKKICQDGPVFLGNEVFKCKK